MANFATILAAITSFAQKAGPVLSWLASNYGTYSTVIAAVLAALTSIAAGDKASGLKQLAQILTVLLTGGVVTSVVKHVHDAKTEARALRMAMAPRPDDRS